jgi:hypothetical protein
VELISSNETRAGSVGHKGLRNAERVVQATGCSVVEATDSHFISAAFSLGWETSRCQITAWNDSVCAVMVSGLITGIRMQASDTWARKSAVAANNATDRGPHLFGILEGAHQVGANSAFSIVPAD